MSSSTAELILQTPENNSEFHLSVLLSPLEHKIPFNSSILQVPCLYPIGKLNAPRDRRKAFMEKLTREKGTVYEITSKTHPKCLTTLLKKVYKEEKALLISYFISICHMGQGILYPMSQNRAILVKSESFQKELSKPTIKPELNPLVGWGSGG